MVNCSKFVCSKNLLDTILLLLDSIQAIIILLVNWSTAVLNLLSCRINWIPAIDSICVNCSNCRPLYIRTVDTNFKKDINFARIAITRQIFCFKNTYGRNQQRKWCTCMAVRCYVRLGQVRLGQVRCTCMAVRLGGHVWQLGQVRLGQVR